jgi:cell wall-associated protease
MKKLIVVAFLFSQTIAGTFAQKAAPQNWFNLDQKQNKVPGVSTERAYNELLKNKESKPVIVAVIDGGTEVDHEDLKSVIWINEKEIAGNNIDDDGNGYVDDVHGWNFIGGKNGDIKEDNLELVRMYKAQNERFANATPADKATPGYAEYIKIRGEYTKRRNEAEQTVKYLEQLLAGIDKIVAATGKENPTKEDYSTYKPADKSEEMLLSILKASAAKKVPVSELKGQLQPAIDYYKTQLEFGLNPDLDTRSIVGDNYADVKERFYGNNHYEGPKGDHGTHVAGIIAAIRNNDLGMNGVANNVKIMVVRVVPDGDERDKDVANGIRYAADNGARVINMSFGKGYSPEKGAVDEAVKYAVSKDVLIVHAAGNDANNIDTIPNFPNDIYLNTTTTAASWIEVGASSWKKGKEIPADFSNYGKNNVDVFAPGVDIYSTIPDSKYASFNGTSMAAPVTAGVAALLRSYYPDLTANQVKEILMQSSVKVKGKVLRPGEGKKREKTTMTELCRTGGVVNAYEAIKLAESMSKK